MNRLKPNQKESIWRRMDYISRRVNCGKEIFEPLIYGMRFDLQVVYGFKPEEVYELFCEWISIHPDVMDEYVYDIKCI